MKKRSVEEMGPKGVKIQHLHGFPETLGPKFPEDPQHPVGPNKRSWSYLNALPLFCPQSPQTTRGSVVEAAHPTLSKSQMKKALGIQKSLQEGVAWLPAV